jgi:hypothetical protein
MKTRAQEPAAETRTAAAGDVVRAALAVPGLPLDSATRERFEAAFACDLGHVRIHTDALAARAARELDAVAFALGRDVFFSTGAYEPHSRRGGALVAHELSHAIEDPRTVDPATAGGLQVAAPDSATERSATTAAGTLDRVAFAVAPAPAPRAQRPQIARFAAGLLLRDPRDPAQLVGTLVTMIKVALANDPDDKLGRVRRSIDFLDADTRKLALEQLSHDLLSPDWQHLSELLEKSAPAATEGGDAREAPPVDADAKEDQAEKEASPNAAVTEEAAPDEEQAGDADAAAPKLDDGQEKAKGKDGKRDAGEARDPAAAKNGTQLHGAHPHRKKRAGGGAHAHLQRPRGGGGHVALPSISIPEPAEGPEPASETATPESEDGAPGESEPIAEAQAPVADEVPAADERPVAADDTRAALAEPAAESAAVEEDAAADEAPPEEAPAAEGEPEAAAPDADASAESAHAEIEAPAAEGAAPAAQLTDVPSETDDNSETPHGGGSSGSAIPEPAEDPAAAVPVDGEPAAVLGAVADEAPDRLDAALNDVRGAIGRTVGSDRQELAAHPPELSAATAARAAALEDPGAAAPMAAAGAASIDRVPAGSPPPSVALPPAPEPAPAAAIPTPRITSDADGHITADDAREVSEAVEDLPTTDPALDQPLKPAPDVDLSGAANPDLADQQRDKLTEATTAAASAGRTDAAALLGEDHIVPAQPLGRVRGEVPPASAGGGAGAAAPGAEPDRAVAIVAREKSASDVTAAAHAGSADLAAKRTEQHAKETQQRADSQQALDDEITQNAAEQRKTRESARLQVRTQRKGWNKEQDDLVTTTAGDGAKAVVDARADIKQKSSDAHAKAQAEVDKTNSENDATRKEAEKKARDEKARAKQESDDAGFFSRVASAIGSFFDKIASAIHGFFNWARDQIKKAIAAVTKLVSDIIDAVRDVIVGLIKAVGDVLIAIGDRMLAAFPALRDRFRATIHGLVDKAVNAVNELADGLKKGITALLNLLGKALTALLDAYEALYMAALDLVAGAVKRALAAAKALIDAIGTFAVLIRDIARNPGQWISNFGSACVDGVKNHLWTELKAAVKEWFNSKVEAVVGVGKFIYNALFKGGFSFRRIAAMAWTAVKAAIPPAIIQFLIEKVIAMIVPAAGAVMAIIEGLQAAWATVSRIIAAFEKFVAFLKAVKDGNAGILLARTIAAAAVAVIDFTANFIISKIGKAAKSLGTKLKSIAAKLMALAKRGLKAVGRAAKAVGKLAVRAIRAGGRGLRAAGRAIRDSRIGRAVRGSRAGRFIGTQAQRVKKAVADGKERFNKWRERRRENAKARHDAKVARAKAELPGKIGALVEAHQSAFLLRARLAIWRLSYGLRTLAIANRTRESFDVTASASPPWMVFEKIALQLGAQLQQTLRKVAMSLRNVPRVRNAFNRLYRQRMLKSGLRIGTEDNPHVIEPGPGVVAEAFFQAANPARPWTSSKYRTLNAPDLVTMNQTFSRGSGHIFVRNAGTYEDMVATADAITTGRKTPEQKAQMFGRLEQQMIKGGFTPELMRTPGFKNVASLAPFEQVRIEEMARNRAQIVRQSMQMRQLASGVAPSLESGLIDRNPMALKGAVRASNAADLQLGFKPQQEYASPANSAKVEAFMDSELELVIRELYALMTTTEPMIATKDGLEHYVQQKFEEYLRVHVMSDFDL